MMMSTRATLDDTMEKHHLDVLDKVRGNEIPTCPQTMSTHVSLNAFILLRADLSTGSCLYFPAVTHPTSLLLPLCHVLLLLAAEVAFVVEPLVRLVRNRISASCRNIQDIASACLLHFQLPSSAIHKLTLDSITNNKRSSNSICPLPARRESSSSAN